MRACEHARSIAPPLLISFAYLLPSFLAPSSPLSLSPSLLRSVPSSLVPFLNPSSLNHPLHPLPLAPSFTSSPPPSHFPSIPPTPLLLRSILPSSFPACLPPAVQITVHRMYVCLASCTAYCVAPSDAWN